MLLHSIAVIALQENPASDFADMGKLMIAGVILAVGLALAFVAIQMRLQARKPPRENFISINSRHDKA